MPDEPPRARWRVAGAPLDPAVRTRLRLDAVWPWPDAAVACGRNVGREVRRIEGAPPLLVKAFVRGHAGTARREARMVELAAAAGLLVPRRVAELVRDDGARALVLAPVAGQPLVAALRSRRGGERRRLLGALADTLRSLARAGLEHRQLHAWHLLAADGADGAPRIAILDWAAACVRRGRRAPPPAAADLAALFATIGRRDLSLAERARLLAALVAAPERRRYVMALRRAQVASFRKGRLPEPELALDVGSAGGRVVVGARAAATLQPRATDAMTWLAPAGGVAVRERDGRVNLRWPDPPGDPGAVWFGKRFERPGRRWPLRSRAPAFAEWVHWRALAALGLAVPELIAVARVERGPSVIWTRGVTPGTTLRERLPQLAAPRERRAALAAAIRIARRLHAAGFVHRDLYLDHFLIAGASHELVLIDPSRVERHARVPERRRLKDLAALEFSARAAGASRVERWRALLEYVHGGRRAARRLAPAVLRRAARIAAHERRHGRPGPPA